MIPPDASAAFVANMEDVLEVYQRARGQPETPRNLPKASKSSSG